MAGRIPPYFVPPHTHDVNDILGLATAGGGVASADFVFTDVATGQPGVYTVWSELVAAVNAAPGLKTITFLSSTGSLNVTEDGTYDLANTLWVGGGDSPPSVTFGVDVLFSGFPLTLNNILVTLDDDGAGQWSVAAGEVRYLYIDRAGLGVGAASTGGISVAATGTLLVFNTAGSLTGGGATAPVITVATGGAVYFYGYDNSVLSGQLYGGSGDIFYVSDSVSRAPTGATGWSGTFTPYAQSSQDIVIAPSGSVTGRGGPVTNTWARAMEMLDGWGGGTPATIGGPTIILRGDVTIPAGAYAVDRCTFVLINCTLTISNGVTFPLSSATSFLRFEGEGTIVMANGVATPIAVSTATARIYFGGNVRLSNAAGTTFISATDTSTVYVDIDEGDQMNTFNDNLGRFMNRGGSGQAYVTSRRFCFNIDSDGAPLRIVQKVRMTGTTTNAGNAAITLPNALAYIPIPVGSNTVVRGVVWGRGIAVPRNPSFTVAAAITRELTAASTTLRAGGAPTALFADGCSVTLSADTTNAGLVVTCAGVAAAGTITWTAELELVQEVYN